MPDIYHFFQQLVNGLTIGSTYALIAIGYTMVYGIIGMINFAHGEVYMIGSYIAFIAIAGLTMMGLDSVPLLLTAAFIASIVVTSAYGYSIERIAALMRHGFYIGNALRMQLQGQRQRFGRRLAGVVVGRGADAAGDESGQAV